MEITGLRRTSCLGLALLVVSTASIGCFRTPLGHAPTPTPDSGADRPDAPNLAGVEADLAPDLRPDVSSDLLSTLLPDLAPDLRPDLALDLPRDLLPDLRPDLAPDLPRDLLPDLRPDLAPDLQHDLAPDGKPLAVALVSVSAGNLFACGVKTNGTVACWGDNY